MIIETPVIRIPEDEMPDMATAATEANDPRVKMEMMRGQPVSFEGEVVGMVILPRIDLKGFVQVVANIRDGIEVEGKYLVPSFRINDDEEGLLALQSITLSDKHPDASIEPITCES